MNPGMSCDCSPGGPAVAGNPLIVPFLCVIKGPVVRQLYALQGETTVLGRHPACQIVLDNGAVSRQHARISQQGESYFVEDLSSRNGTQLNGAPLCEPTELHDHDELRICEFVFEYLVDEPTSPGSLTHVGRIAGDAPRYPVAPPVRPKVLVETDAPERPSSILDALDMTDQPVRIDVRPDVKLRSILEITSALSRVVKLDDVLSVVLSALLRIFPSADGGFVLLREDLLANPAGQGPSGTGTVSTISLKPQTGIETFETPVGKLRLRAIQVRDQRSERVLPLSLTVVSEAMQSKRALLSSDVGSDQRFQASESLIGLSMRSLMCVPIIASNQEVLGVFQVSTNQSAHQFSTDDLDLLVCVSTQAALTIENASLNENLIRQREMERELEFANHVQLGFLPKQPPRAPGYEFADFYEAALQVGGDYFDYIPLPNGEVVVALGDVAGKGVAAALLMARLHAAVRFELLRSLSVLDAITQLNQDLTSGGLGFRFITLVLIAIHPKEHRIKVVNAGHIPPWLRHADGAVTLVGERESGMPLGIQTNQKFKVAEAKLAPGDLVLLCTDGVTEALSPGRQLYSRDRVTKFLGGPAVSAAEWVDRLVHDVDLFSPNGSSAIANRGKPIPVGGQRDDLCVVAFRRLS